MSQSRAGEEGGLLNLKPMQDDMIKLATLGGRESHSQLGTRVHSAENFPNTPGPSEGHRVLDRLHDEDGSPDGAHSLPERREEISGGFVLSCILGKMFICITKQIIQL